MTTDREGGRRAVLADDFGVIRGLLAALPGAFGLEVVGIGRVTQDVIELVQREAAELALLDLDMPGLGGLDGLRALVQACPETRMVALSQPMVPVVRTAIDRCGAWPVDKAAGTEELAVALRRGLSDGAW